MIRSIVYPMVRGLASGMMGVASSDSLFIKADGIPANLALSFDTNEYGCNGARCSFDDLFTFSRASVGTYIGSDGLLKTAAINEKRFQYTNGVCDGFLSEGASTNNMLWSDDLTNAVWVKTNCTAAKNAVGPDGVTNSASTLTATGASASCYQTLVATVNRTYSVWLKRKTGTGTVLLTRNGGTTTTDVTSSISGGGWVRVEMNSTVTGPVIGIILGTSGDEVYVFGNQDETLSFHANSFATSTINTTTAAVTRSAEVCTNGSGNVIPFLSWYSNSNDSVLYKHKTVNTRGSVSSFIGLGSAGFGVNNGNYQWFGNMGSRIIGLNNVATAASSGAAQYGCKEQVLYAKTGTTSGAGSLNLGAGHSVHKKFYHWSARISNAELQRLTT